MVNYASERRRRGQGSGVAASLAHSVPRRRPSAPLGPSLPPCPNGGHPSAHPSTVTDRSIDRSDTLFDSRFACVFLAARLWSLSVLLSFSWPELRGSYRRNVQPGPARVHRVWGVGVGEPKGEFPALLWTRVSSGRERGRTLCSAREGEDAARPGASELASELASERAVDRLSGAT